MLKSGGWLRHYEILEPLGEGGMGEVFRARDSRLARDVAVKVLPERFKLDRYRMARFDREARVLASLNHPNIAAVHAIEECGDAYALVMELVEGETLAQRISRGSIPWRDAIHIAEQIAAGLEGAHELGVVHRDVKPANVCIRQDGAVKLLDFGLVKAVESPAVSAASVVTATADELAAGQKIGMGTPSYMSPEQARGLPVDKRTDIWAFGCVLYEMLTGKRAFAGDDAAGTIARVIEREPDFGALPSATPESIHRLLKRCLMKDRQHRLRDIGDAYLELGEVSRNLLGAPDPRKPHFSAPYLAAVAVTVAVAGVVWWFTLRSDSGVPGVNGPAAELSVSARAVGDTSVRGAGRATDGVKIANALPNSIAVLPFDNLSPDPADAYFAVGIHEELLNQLTKLGELHVVSRTSVQGYRDTNKPTPAIARELGVETVLDGSVRYADGMLS